MTIRYWMLLSQKHQLFLMHPSGRQQPAESGRFHFHIGGCQWCDGSYQHSVGDGAGLLSSIPAGSQYTRWRRNPVIHARLNTLRIMKGDQTTLTIKHVPSGQEICVFRSPSIYCYPKSTVIPAMRWAIRNILTGRIHTPFYSSYSHRIWGFRRYAWE